MSALSVVSFSGCQQASIDNDIESGNTVMATISAQALLATENTKADISELVYYLEVYCDGEFYGDLGSSTDGNFSTDLIPGLDYTFVAWADYDKGYYDAAGTLGEANLTAVNIITDAYVINDEYRDAFAGTYDVEKFDGAAIAFTLSRPLARINVATTDITELVVASSLPTDVKLSYTTELYTSYNVLTGEVNADSQLLETTTAALVDATTGDISYDYLFAPSEGGVVDFTATFYKEDGSEYSSYSFTNIAYKQNHQTNISGSLLGDVLVEYEKITVEDLKAGTYPTSDYWLIEDNTIPDQAFYSSSSSTLSLDADRKISIYCPNATSIGDWTFSECSSLATIDLPNVTSIGELAFLECSSLATVSIPKVTNVDYCAFRDCTALKTMTIATESQVTFWGNYVLHGVTTTNIDLTVGSLNSGDIDIENKTWNGYTFNSITVL